MTKYKSLPKLIAIVGQTASGKSDLAIKLAGRFQGAIISADSRQIYRGMDIGTGKIQTQPREFPELSFQKSIPSARGIPHFGIDIADPAEQYSVASYQDYVRPVITNIVNAGFLPILCGGTGQWVDTVTSGQALPPIPPNNELRAKLEELSTNDLFSQLLARDPERAKTIDKHNRRRLIRALEVNTLSGKPVQAVVTFPLYDVLWIGINKDPDLLKQHIAGRLTERLSAGMIGEVKTLHKSGLSWRRLEDFGLEYKYCALVLQNKIKETELYPALLTEIIKYAKRQKTWFKKNKNIHWIKDCEEAKTLVDNFIIKRPTPSS